MSPRLSFGTVRESPRQAIYAVRVHDDDIGPAREVDDIAERMREKLHLRGEIAADVVVVQGDSKETLRLYGTPYSVGRVRAAMFNAAISWRPIELRLEFMIALSRETAFRPRRRELRRRAADFVARHPEPRGNVSTSRWSSARRAFRALRRRASACWSGRAAWSATRAPCARTFSALATEPNAHIRIAAIPSAMPLVAKLTMPFQVTPSRGAVHGAGPLVERAARTAASARNRCRRHLSQQRTDRRRELPFRSIASNICC